MGRSNRTVDGRVRCTRDETEGLEVINLDGHQEELCEICRDPEQYLAENWGGDPEGPLAKALEAARAKKPKELQLVRLPCYFCGAEALTEKGTLYTRAQLPSGKWDSVAVCIECLHKQRAGVLSRNLAHWDADFDDPRVAGYNISPYSDQEIAGFPSQHGIVCSMCGSGKFKKSMATYNKVHGTTVYYPCNRCNHVQVAVFHEPDDGIGKGSFAAENTLSEVKVYVERADNRPWKYVTFQIPTHIVNDEKVIHEAIENRLIDILQEPFGGWDLISVKKLGAESFGSDTLEDCEERESGWMQATEELDDQLTWFVDNSSKSKIKEFNKYRGWSAETFAANDPPSYRGLLLKPANHVGRGKTCDAKGCRRVMKHWRRSWGIPYYFCDLHEAEIDKTYQAESFGADFDYHYNMSSKYAGSDVLDALRGSGDSTKAQAIDWLIDNGFLHSDEQYNAAYVLALGDAIGISDDDWDAESFAATTSPAGTKGSGMSRLKADAIINKVKAHMGPHLDFIEVCGSYRRGNSTPKDLDFVVIPKEGVTLPNILPPNQGVNWVGDKKAQVVIDNETIDFRVSSLTGLGAALMYFTGPAGYNIGMRMRAKKMGLKLNEYGVFDRSTGVYIAGATEADVYQALGKSYKSPDLRGK